MTSVLPAASARYWQRGIWRALWRGSAMVVLAAIVLALAATPVFAQTSTAGSSSASLTASNVFSFMDSQVETPLISTVSQIISSFLSYAATPLRSALVLYIALTGILIIRGYTDEAGSALLGRFLKMGLVVWVMTGSGVFQQYVFTFFFTTLPTSLQSAVSQGGLGSNFQASTFDNVWYQAYLAGWALWDKGTTSGSWMSPGSWLAPMAGAILFWAAAGVSTVVGFAIWLVSRVFLGLIIAVGPILIPLALFHATRAIFEHWISSMISCVLLQIMTIIMMTAITGTEQQILTSFKTAMQSSTTSTVDGMGLLLAGVMFFAVAAFVGLHLPQVATSIAGGVHFHTRSLGAFVWQSASGAIRTVAAAGRASVGAGKGINKGFSWASRRMNPPGNSMSA